MRELAAVPQAGHGIDGVEGDMVGRAVDDQDIGCHQVAGPLQNLAGLLIVYLDRRGRECVVAGKGDNR